MKRKQIKIVCYDANDNVIIEKGREFWVYWGDVTFVVVAIEQKEAAQKIILSFCDTKTPFPDYGFIRVKPKGKGEQSDCQEIIFSKEQLINDMVKEETMTIYYKPNLKIVK